MNDREIQRENERKRGDCEDEHESVENRLNLYRCVYIYIDLSRCA